MKLKYDHNTYYNPVVTYKLDIGAIKEWLSLVNLVRYRKFNMYRMIEKWCMKG